MIKRLNELVPMQSGKVNRIRGMGPLRHRLMDMGLVPGADIKVVRFAPLGDPIEYQVKGYHLSLRKHEAQHILVDVDIEPLSGIEPGSTVKLISVFGGRQFIERLTLMGLKPGLTMQVVQNNMQGPITIRVTDKDLRIGRNMAQRIFIEPVP